MTEPPNMEQVAEYLLDINRMTEAEVRAKWDVERMQPALDAAFAELESYGIIERVD